VLISRSLFGETFKESDIAGVYIYPDKTRVASVEKWHILNIFCKSIKFAPNWIGISLVAINGEALDLNTCISVQSIKREYKLKEGCVPAFFYGCLPK